MSIVNSGNKMCHGHPHLVSLEGIKILVPIARHYSFIAHFYWIHVHCISSTHILILLSAKVTTVWFHLSGIVWEKIHVMLTNSSDKVVSGCLLVYQNVLTVSVPFQGLKKLVCDCKFISSKGCIYLRLYGVCSAFQDQVFVAQLQQFDLTVDNSQNISSGDLRDTTWRLVFSPLKIKGFTVNFFSKW